MSSIRLAGVVRESIVDGPGLRFTVFVQGCPHGCPGCHNPETWDPAGGYDCDSGRIRDAFFENPLLAGITFSGGEPIEQAEALSELAEAITQRGKNAVLFSGYTYEALCDMALRRPAVAKLLDLCFLLIDGPYRQQERDLTLRFAGSRNQRLIDLPSSRREGRAILYVR